MIKLTEKIGAGPLKAPWKKCIGVGRAYELLRQDLLDHLAWLQEKIGFEQCRFHALFHDDMDVMHLDKDGKPFYQWHHIDKIYDSLLEIGLKPFVELNPMPASIASGTQTMFYYHMNVTPPKDWDLWQDLIYQFTKHVTDRYGEDEVATWLFEVWNEPNLEGFWSGTKEEYFELYKRSAIAVKQVSERYKVGGPASSKAFWLKDLINYCHENKIPIDFVSTHLYAQDEYVEFPDRQGSPYAIGTFFTETVKSARQEILDSPMPDLELHWTEWNTQGASPERPVSWGQNPDVDTSYAAAHIVKHCLELDDTLDSFSYWVASDIFEEGGIPDAAFSCTYGMLSIHGIPKAAANAFVLLNKLKGNLLDITDSDAPQFTGVAASKTADRLYVLLYYFNPHEIADKDLPVWDGVLETANILGDGRFKAISASILPGKGSCWEKWQEMGCPLNISKFEEDYLWAAAQPEYRMKLMENGKYKFSLQPGQVMYLEFSPVAHSSTAADQLDADFAEWDKIMGEKSRT